MGNAPTQHEKLIWTYLEQILEILFCAGLKKGDSLLNTIVTIPWLPFHAPT